MGGGTGQVARKRRRHVRCVIRDGVAMEAEVAEVEEAEVEEAGGRVKEVEEIRERFERMRRREEMEVWRAEGERIREVAKAEEFRALCIIQRRRIGTGISRVRRVPGARERGVELGVVNKGVCVAGDI